MKVLLVDPSLFTGPYDAMLTKGLRSAGVEPAWAVRGLRPGEEPDLDRDAIALRCYRMTDGPRRAVGRRLKALKGVEHVADAARIATFAAGGGFDLVHVQWAELPAVDARMIARIRRRRPVILTVHDTTPLNGAAVNPLQRAGFDRLLAAPDAIVVHTEGAREALRLRGVADDRIAVVPHGPLPLAHAPRAVIDKAPGRWRIVLFGRLQTYKGIDVLIEALGLMTAADRARIEVVVAGELFMDAAPLRARAAALGLDAATFSLRVGRLGGQAMADLLGSADAFVFPYRAIETSGVLYLIAAFRKWMVASALGTFVEAAADGADGALVPPGDARALAQAMIAGIGQVPTSAAASFAPDWTTIGARTAALYRAVRGQQLN